jgi:hypothetical protein
VTGEADRTELPVWRYLPGVNNRHKDDAFDHVKALCPERTDDRNASGNIAWHYGIRLFNEGYYWETHEVLEEVWLRALPNSRERFLVQSVIHLANGALKRRLGRIRAAERLAVMAEGCLARAFAGGKKSLMGIAAGATQRNCRNLLSGEEFEHLALDYAL